MKFRLLLAAFSMAVCGNVVNAQVLDDNPVFNSYFTFSVPTVDGIISPGEWDAAGDPYVLTFEPGHFTHHPEDPYGGNDDLSYQFRSMWQAPWDVFFLVEVTDDIAMDDEHNPPGFPWQRDQVELYIDGDELSGGEIRWWEGDNTIERVEPYGKFGVARTSEFEGNTGLMHFDQGEILENNAVVAAVATETGENANYFVEYHVSLQPAFEDGLFEGGWAEEFETLVPDEPGNPVPGTVIKFDISITDNDNFGEADPYHSGNFSTPRDADAAWNESNGYANLQFTNEFTGSDLDCDFDANGTCDLDDIDALTVEAAPGDSTNPDFDLDGDGQVGDSDIAAWLQLAGPENGFDTFLYGDANLNGTVDATDLNAIGISWGMQDENRWSRGNSGGSGVAADDLNRLALNWQMSSTPLATSQAAVPEPTSLVLIGIGLCALLSYRHGGTRDVC